MAKYQFGELEAMARQAGFDPSISPVMAAISLAESGGDPFAHNPKYPDDSYGLFQINMLDEPGYKLGQERRQRYGLRSNEQLFDPMENLKAAKDIYDNQGLNAWSVYQSGAYKKHLPSNFTAAEIPRSAAQKMSTIAPVKVDTSPPMKTGIDIQSFGGYGAPVGRSRSSDSIRKAGDSLLQVGKSVPPNKSLAGTILEYLPIGLAALALLK
jgi:hypothetical protein